MSLRTLQERIVKRFPNAVLALDEPASPRGSTFLDVRLNGHAATVEWRENSKFGITSRPDSAYGEGVDESYESEEDAFKRLVSLLLSQTKTAPRKVRLRELRQAAGLSQVELADRMAIRQASVSKIEQGRDLKLSTLSSLVSALGGELQISARFPDGNEQRLDLASLMGEK